jgi:hypothetical protein
MKFSLGNNNPVSGQASTVIEADNKHVFAFIAENFFTNYPKWAAEVVELEPLDGDKVCIGAKGRQVKTDNETLTESIFEITQFQPCTVFSLKGLDTPYVQTYLTETDASGQQTTLTFKFDLLEIELFMRPFEKLIRVAIEDGVETAVENIKNLITSDPVGA